jgi:hypothetical protein
LISFLRARPQLLDLALAIGFFAGFCGLLYEFFHVGRASYGIAYVVLMLVTGGIQWVRSLCIAKAHAEDIPNGGQWI